MTVRSDIRPPGGTHAAPPVRTRGFPITTLVVGILGGVATFLGAFILLGGDDEWVGLGGDLAWRVGDLSPAWGYGLLAGGILALLGALVLVASGRATVRSRDAAARASWSDVIAHGVVFLIVNAILWTQNLLVTGELNYALWATVPWAIGLGIHALATYSEVHRTSPR